MPCGIHCRTGGSFLFAGRKDQRATENRLKRAAKMDIFPQAVSGADDFFRSGTPGIQKAAVHPIQLLRHPVHKAVHQMHRGEIVDANAADAAP